MRLGAIHRRQPLAIRPLSKRANLHLMIPPSRADWFSFSPSDGDPLGNDTFGCCCEVADYRVVQLHKAVLWGERTKPLVSDILKRYSALTGFSVAAGKPDNGTDTVADVSDWCAKGIQVADQTLDCPHWTIAHPTDPIEVNLSVAHAGPVLVTLGLPESAQDLNTWSKPPSTGAGWDLGGWGYHRVVCGRYEGDTRWLRSWGIDIEVSPLWWNAYVVAVDVLLSRQWLNTTGLTPLGLDFDALQEDISFL